MQNAQQQVIDKFKEVCALAQKLYGVDMSKVRLGFNLKGRVAGWAIAKNVPGRGRDYLVRFNHDMIVRGCEETLNDMLNDTVPHELAHIVCFMRPELGKNHDAGWARVCRALGGGGGRTHSMDVVYGKGTTYEYTTDCGNRVRLNERRHAYVQSGGTLTYRKGLGRVTKGCAYSIVGVQGRSLQNPIVKQAEHQPAARPGAQRITITGTAGELVQKLFPPTTPVVVAPVVKPLQAPAAGGESKAAVSRRIMLSGYQSGKSYEEIIQAMIFANGYDRQLARGTFKANAPKVGIPASFYI